MDEKVGTHHLSQIEKREKGADFLEFLGASQEAFRAG